jgi:hypothetical protein
MLKGYEQVKKRHLNGAWPCDMAHPDKWLTLLIFMQQTKFSDTISLKIGDEHPTQHTHRIIHRLMRICPCLLAIFDCSNHSSLVLSSPSTNLTSDLIVYTVQPWHDNVHRKQNIQEYNPFIGMLSHSSCTLLTMILMH